MSDLMLANWVVMVAGKKEQQAEEPFRIFSDEPDSDNAWFVL